MANVFVEENTLSAIANAIRNKNGTTDLLKPGAMAAAIEGIQAGGEVDLIGIIERSATDIVIPNGCKKIGSAIFSGCDNLVNVFMPDSVESIGASAFYHCNNLALTALPKNLTTLENSSFAYCPSLALTSLPESITSIGTSVFRDCENITLRSLPSGITRIENETFSGCTKLALESLHNGITYIGSKAFLEAGLNLTHLPSGITTILGQAFYNCLTLTSITFKGIPTTINTSCFTGCKNLTIINVPWAEGAVSGAPWGASNATINYNYTGD